MELRGVRELEGVVGGSTRANGEMGGSRKERRGSDGGAANPSQWGALVRVGRTEALG